MFTASQQSDPCSRMKSSTGWATMVAPYDPPWQMLTAIGCVDDRRDGPGVGGTCAVCRQPVAPKTSRVTRDDGGSSRPPVLPPICSPVPCNVAVSIRPTTSSAPSRQQGRGALTCIGFVYPERKSGHVARVATVTGSSRPGQAHSGHPRRFRGGAVSSCGLPTIRRGTLPGGVADHPGWSAPGHEESPAAEGSRFWSKNSEPGVEPSTLHLTRADMPGDGRGVACEVSSESRSDGLP